MSFTERSDTMQCQNHIDKETINTCSYCGKPFCKECLIDLNGKKYCKEHILYAFTEAKQLNLDTCDIDYNNGSHIKENAPMPIKLKSPDTFPDELQRYTIIYILIAILFTILLTKEIHIILAIFIGPSVAFIIANFVIIFKTATLKTIKYYLPGDFSKDEIVRLITFPLAQLTMTVENLSDRIRVKHNGINYDVYLNSENNTFTVWVNNTLLSATLLGRIYVDVYLKVIFSMPIIIYTIQSKIEKRISLDI